MKALSWMFMAAMAFAITEAKSHAFVTTCLDFDYHNRCNDGEMWMLYTSTTTFGPIGLIASGEIDLSNPDTRNLLVAQSEQVLNGQGNAINQSENLVHALAQADGVSDEALARAVESLEASGSEISAQSIKNALK